MVSQNLQLEIQGETDFKTSIIDSISYKKLHIDLNGLNKEIDSLQNKLFKIGYIENKLEEISKKNDSSYQAIFQLKNRYDTIYIYFEKDIIKKSTLQNISKQVFDDYFILDFQKIETSLQYINSKIIDLGFPFNELQLQNISIKNKNSLQATLTTSNKTQKRGIDKIILKGYEKFPESYLKHYLRIKKKNTFNLSEIKKKTEALDGLRFANQTKDPEVLFTKDSTILYLYVEKSKSNSFDGFLGFGTNKTTNKIDFNGYLNLNLTNNLNYGESFNLIYKSDENEQKTFKVHLSAPYLFNSPIGTEVGLEIFKKDSTFTTVNQTAKIFYPINNKTNIYVGIKSSMSNNLLSEENLINSIQDYRSNIYSIRFSHIKPQKNKLFNKNLALDIEAGTGKRSFSSNSENQTQLSLEAFKIINLNNKNSAFLRINGSSLFSKTYLENELYRFGGINSIRGFEENSLIASQYGVINSEYRYQLNQTIYIHSIIDFAYLENNIISQKDKLYGFGFGFGLLTKAGLLKFNYANGKNESQTFKFSNSKIHISLSAIF
ncbi:hypothetical protein [Oceanihabitans sediminis]|uniref:hypothetical protein n=1 Tax=Oceanihabitans sediminis TaxID=1812012 RepID=UPI00299D631F|nr:hypothetical protein [Oceanihabitans sediminis]MDX1773793.1 hypothetical protein [Oceanihabitans sediminis]